MFDMTKVLKFDNTGLVDQPATVEAFTAALGEYAALQAADNEAVSAAVKAVWDESPASSVMALDSLATLATFKITKDPGQIPAVKDRCLNHIRSAKALYKIAKGRNGGVSRVKPEQPATETASS